MPPGERATDTCDDFVAVAFSDFSHRETYYIPFALIDFTTAFRLMQLIFAYIARFVGAIGKNLG